MKLIGITQRTDTGNAYAEKRDCLDTRWYTFLGACGCVPVVLPNHSASLPHLLSTIKLDGLLFSGGNNSPERQAAEDFLLQTAFQQKLPLLGVCHGMQIIQQHFGIRLLPVHHHVTDTLTILIHDKAHTVNSYHDQGTHETVPELHVWAKASDGIVKAIQHIHLPVAGIMWHPERHQPFSPRDITFVKQFFGVK